MRMGVWRKLAVVAVVPLFAMVLSTSPALAGEIDDLTGAAESSAVEAVDDVEALEPSDKLTSDESDVSISETSEDPVSGASDDSAPPAGPCRS